MKVDIVCFTGTSGLADYSVSLARALAPHADVQMVSAHALPRVFDRMGFKVLRVFRRARHYPLDIVAFFTGVLARRPDWILLQGPLKFPWFDALVVRLLRRFGVHAAITVHDVLPHYVHPWSRAESAFYYRSFDAVIAHSAAARDALQAMGIRADILVVPHGSYDLFNLSGIGRDAAREKIGGIGADDFLVLFFGHLEPRKGLAEFIAMAGAANADPGRAHLKFLVAGSNDLARHGAGHAAQLEAARMLPNMVIHDRRIAFEDVENYFAASDVVALPYLEGSTSGVLKLALEFGKPVVATRIGDLPEQIPAGGGVLVPCDGAIAANCLAAIDLVAKDHQAYAGVMSAARGNADWRDIAATVLRHLEALPSSNLPPSNEKTAKYQ